MNVDEFATEEHRGSEPVTLINPERSRPHWPLGASFRRDCLEHLAKNAFIEFQRQGQVWKFGLGERLKNVAA